MTYLTLHALFAVRALPLVAGDVADQVEREANTGGVARGVALRAVQQHLRLELEFNCQSSKIATWDLQTVS